MKNQTIEMQKRLLDELIDRYFDGETSLAEEQLLREMLTKGGIHSEKADEARAVLGVFASARAIEGLRLKSDGKKMRPRLLRHISTVAASIAIMLGAGFTVTTVSAGERIDREFYTRVAGQITSNSEVIDANIRLELSCIANANREIEQSINSDLTLLGEALNSDTNKTQNKQ